MLGKFTPLDMKWIMAIMPWLVRNLVNPSLPLFPPSSARQRYTPPPATNVGTAARSPQVVPPTTSHHQTSNNSTTSSGMQANASSSVPPTPIPPHTSLWVIFGVKDTFEFDDIESINMPSMLMNDASFFAELRRLDSKYRWPVLKWFSPWVFTHCKFVRVRMLHYDHLANQALC